MKQAIKPVAAVLNEGYKKQLAANEYMLILNPHEELRKKIQQVRKEFADKYDTAFHGGQPNLTLVRFTQLAMLEERIVQRLRTIAMSYCPFKVEMKGFGSFPSHTIFIQVTSKLPIRGLQKEVKEVQRLMKLDKEHKPHFLDEPYISIGRKLLPGQYDKAWLEYSHRNFTGRFVADGMLLLKRTAMLEGRPSIERPAHPWQIVEKMTFRNMPVAIRQGELFA